MESLVIRDEVYVPYKVPDSFLLNPHLNLPRLFPSTRSDEPRLGEIDVLPDVV